MNPYLILSEKRFRCACLRPVPVEQCKQVLKSLQNRKQYGMLITYLFPYEIRLNLIKQKHSNSRTRALITAYLRQWVMVGVFLGRRAIALTCMQACHPVHQPSHPVHQASHPVHQASHPAHQASSQNLHVLRINSHVLWSMTTLFCKQWH